MKKGLVLEGGGMRGMFTSGVLDVFMDNGIEFDGMVGVSAGACFGCNYKSRQRGRAIRYNMKYCSDDRYVSFKNLLTTGNIFGVDFCYKQIPFKLDPWDDKAFRENPMELYVTCTDAVTGKSYYHRCSEGLDVDIEYIRASSSMPIVSQVVEIGDRKFIDGGTSDSIPIIFMEQQGYDKNVIILTQPLEFRKKLNKLAPLAKLVHKDYPQIYRLLKNRHKVYNQTLDYVLQQEREGKVFVIRPQQSLGISNACKKPEELKRVYEMGIEAGNESLQRMKEFLEL